LAQIKEETDRELLEVKIDRAAKYKFLGAALILLRNMEKRQLRQKLKAMFTKWKYNQSVNKVSCQRDLTFINADRCYRI
jgi:hypothetical protein